MDFWQNVIAGVLVFVAGTVLVSGSVWLWRRGKAYVDSIHDSIKRLEAANEAQTQRMDELEARFQDTLSGEARTSLIKEVVNLIVSDKERKAEATLLQQEVAKLREDIASSKVERPRVVLPAQPQGQGKPFFNRETLDQL